VQCYLQLHAASQVVSDTCAVPLITMQEPIDVHKSLCNR